MKDLILSKKFSYFFWTQFLGAFNDNVFKNALVILFAYTTTSESESGRLVSLAGGIFILPFIIFSPLAGQLADKFEKSKLIVITKISEVATMIIGVFGLLTNNNFLLLIVLFLMGTQSTFFGPTKYSIIPLVLKKEEDLVGATSLVEMSTFLAILTGTILGGILVAYGAAPVCIAIVAIAILGFFSSYNIPSTKTSNPKIELHINPFKQTYQMLKVMRQNVSIFFGILAISWFWLFGAIYFSQLSVFVRFILNADKIYVTLFLSIFTLSLAIGSLACNRISNKIIELGIVPLAAIGMTIFGVDLMLTDYSSFTNHLINLVDIWNSDSLYVFIRVVFDFFGVGFFGSIFIVPLYSLLQKRSSPQTTSQVIACNNVVNSIFMIISTMLTMLAYKFNYSTSSIFGYVSILNIIVLFIFILMMPELFFRSIAWLKNKTGYKLQIIKDKQKLYPLIIIPEINFYYVGTSSFVINQAYRTLQTGSKKTSLTSIMLRYLKVDNLNSISLIDTLKTLNKKYETLFISEKDFDNLTKEDAKLTQKIKDNKFSICKCEIEKQKKIYQSWRKSTIKIKSI
jgi:MFS family permease